MSMTAYYRRYRLLVPKDLRARIDWLKRRALDHRAKARRLERLRMRKAAQQHYQQANLLDLEARRLARSAGQRPPQFQPAGVPVRASVLNPTSGAFQFAPQTALVEGSGSEFQASTPADVQAAPATETALIEPTPMYKNPVVVGVALLGAYLAYRSYKKRKAA